MSLDQVFGGSQSVPLLSKDQMRFQTAIFKKVLPTVGKDTPTYTGQTIAGVNPLMQSAMSGMQGAASLNPNVNIALNNQLAGAGDPAGVRAMYEAALAPAQRDFQDTLSQVESRYGDVWGRSGAQPMMTGRATAEYGSNLASLLAQLTYQDRQQAMERQANAIPLATGVRSSDIDALNAVYGAGSAQRAIEQQKLLGDYQGWNAKQWYNNPALALGNQQMGIQTQGYVNQPGVFNQIVGAGQGLMNASMSAIRPLG